MLAFKAFSKNLTAIMGNGEFQFEAGKTYKEDSCKCAHNGFHCAANPLCCLTYYNSTNSRFFIVEAGGDINMDGHGTRISCTELTLIKEITLLQMAVYACQYMQKHPKLPLESNYVVENYGECNKAFLIVRGKNPRAKGIKGSVIFFMEEKNGEIKSICPIEIGEDGYEENTEYVYKGGKFHEFKK